MSAATDMARELIDRQLQHPVISLYFDLDPEEFATAPARTSQTRSLLDQARRLAEEHEPPDHAEKTALREDLERIEAYLESDELPVSEARSIALFCSGLDDLFEPVKLAFRVVSHVVIDAVPHIEPLVANRDATSTCVALVNSRVGRVLIGGAARLSERESVDDDVRGQRQGGGWSQDSYENDVDGHLRAVAHDVFRLWQRTHFAGLAIGGPEDPRSRFAGMLHNDLRPLLLSERIDLDVGSATVPEIRDALASLLAEHASAGRAGALAELESRMAGHERVAAGVSETLIALTERRVETLLLSRDYHAAGRRCPTCEMLLEDDTSRCPADGTTTEPVADLREATVQAALAQDAEVIALEEPADELPPARPIAALLRY
ncbi:MAG: hypothetical protein JOZ07_16255 [Solirubrobacterales bacterium]|nr:hypothetical protein [Solirubrobacterales bacterium]